MEEEEFSNLISCFMRVAWTAATGKLQVVDQVVNKDSAISVDMRSMSNQCLNSGLSTGSTGYVVVCLSLSICCRMLQ